ncbi:MAG: ribose 5-phosphate isomerase A [Candidatus Micrarchaeia archaeon]
MSIEKINAAKKALEFVKPDTVIGLGSGSTVFEFLKLLGEKIRNENMRVFGVPTSFDTEMIALGQGIPIIRPDQPPKIDLAIDGADLISKNYLIKGGGGALTREKIIAYEAEKFYVIADEGKLKLENFPVPIEVIPFSVFLVAKKLQQKGYQVMLRMSQNKLGPVITDNGNYIIDALIPKINNPKKLEEELTLIPGVIENGIFTKFDKIIIGNQKGSKIL